MEGVLLGMRLEVRPWREVLCAVPEGGDLGRLKEEPFQVSPVAVIKTYRKGTASAQSVIT